MCRIEPYQSEHRDGVIAVVRAVHEEYGFVWDAEGYHRDLYAIERDYLANGDRFWTLFDDSRIVGCAAVRLHDAESELHRLYLLAAYRGRGLGLRLLETAIAFARGSGCRRMIAWSDVKLPLAHKLYLSHGFRQCGERSFTEPEVFTEYGFLKEPL